MGRLFSLIAGVSIGLTAHEVGASSLLLVVLTGLGIAIVLTTYSLKAALTPDGLMECLLPMPFAVWVCGGKAVWRGELSALEVGWWLLRYSALSTGTVAVVAFVVYVLKGWLG